LDFNLRYAHYFTPCTIFCCSRRANPQRLYTNARYAAIVTCAVLSGASQDPQQMPTHHFRGPSKCVLYGTDRTLGTSALVSQCSHRADTAKRRPLNPLLTRSQTSAMPTAFARPLTAPATSSRLPACSQPIARTAPTSPVLNNIQRVTVYCRI